MYSSFSICFVHYRPSLFLFFFFLSLQLLYLFESLKLYTSALFQAKTGLALVLARQTSYDCFICVFFLIFGTLNDFSFFSLFLSFSLLYACAFYRPNFTDRTLIEFLLDSGATTMIHRNTRKLFKITDKDYRRMRKSRGILFVSIYSITLI